jgi:hypothetical protein
MAICEPVGRAGVANASPLKLKGSNDSPKNETLETQRRLELQGLSRWRICKSSGL